MILFEASPVTRVLVATFVGTCLGLPFRLRTGGIRTHVLVAIGATMFCVAGLRLAGSQDVNLLRVIQGVASGVGFVGAATVLKHGTSISGVNVAASIWTTAALGCEVGLGHDLLLVLSLAPAIAIVSWLLEKIERRGLGRSGGSRPAPDPEQ